MSNKLNSAKFALLAVSCCAFVCVAAAVPAKPAPTRPTAVAMPASALTPDPDAMLIEVYKLLAQNQLNSAQALADKLVEAYPTFRLGHLVRGDLLMMHSFPVSTFGAATNAPPDKLKELRDEARARIKSLSERPNPELIPRAILQLRDDQKHVLVVDAKRSRLYVYENQAGHLKFISDYYITQGKLGVEKSKAGDQKTPLGVYYITSHVPGAKLSDFYGSGALPINYPNEWDKVNGRSGSGIWLHGTPSNSFSRPPLDSDGCLVLTNPDLKKLSETVEIGKTPVVISEQVEFITLSKWNAERDLATKLINDWRLDVESKSSKRWLSNYSSSFKNAQGESLPVWFDKQQILFAGAADISIKLSDVTVFNYPGKGNMLVSTFTQESRYGKNRNVTRKRQYWAKEANRWKIIFEGVI
ncbi:L,D-transpeptidase family protein [Solimicrobium silvestre]|nr:L,D-transpeptidase family protein [Solimicrobium silvestre]